MVREGSGNQWVLYIRRSYKEASAADVSDETQIAMASELVPAGIEPVIISDSGGHNSGRNDQRDGYQQLLFMLRAGLVAGICVYDLSRLARNAKMMLNLKSELDQRQVQLRVATLPGSQFNGATVRFMFGQFCLAAQFQADVDSERMTTMLRGIYERGGHRGHSPFGYRSARDAAGDLVHPRKLVVIPEEAEVVRTVWMGLRTRSLVDLTAWLNRQGIQRRTKRPWTTEATKDIWRRGLFYTGRVVLHRGLDDRPGTHEPILSDAEYRETVAAVAARRRLGPKPKPFRTYLLRGLLQCACGRRMRGEARVQRGSERRYYRCPGPCSARLLVAESAEKTVLDAISSGILPEDIVDAVREELRRRLGTPREKPEHERRHELDARLERLRKQHEWGDLSDADYRARRSGVMTEMAALPDGNKIVLFDRNRRLMTSMAQNIAAATPEQKSELARLLITKAVATNGTVAVVWTGPARPFFDVVGGWYPQGDSNP
jgi:DNA invertase Pin-like site-specific DNA recombinase